MSLSLYYQCLYHAEYIVFVQCCFPHLSGVAATVSYVTHPVAVSHSWRNGRYVACCYHHWDGAVAVYFRAQVVLYFHVPVHDISCVHEHC